MRVSYYECHGKPLTTSPGMNKEREVLLWCGHASRYNNISRELFQNRNAGRKDEECIEGCEWTTQNTNYDCPLLTPATQSGQDQMTKVLGETSVRVPPNTASVQGGERGT